jgi:eukaryotic-like serine/threonine-protein kinase
MPCCQRSSDYRLGRPRHEPDTNLQCQTNTARCPVSVPSASSAGPDSSRPYGVQKVLLMSERPVFADRYEISSRIGRGGMADVFLARDRMLDRNVAIKVLFPEFATDLNFVQRFRREAQSAANLTHPNVVAVYDWGEQSGTYFIVMEYVKGRSLAEIIRAQGVIAPDRAAAIAHDVAAALVAAHRGGLVHRDVKPGNILVADSGEVKVADFGISRNVGGESDLTQTGSVMGTATYFSPEQAQGMQPDTRSDLYSLGIVMYEMATGQPPFTGDNPVAIAYKQVHEMPAAPTRINSSIPTAYEQIVRKLMQKEPSKRFQRAEDVQADLKRFMTGQTAPDPITQARSLPYDATVAQGAVGSTATQALPPTVAAAQQSRAAEAYRQQQTVASPAAPAYNGGYEERRSSPPPARRSPIGAWIGALVGLLALVGLGFGLWKVLNTNNTGDARLKEVPDVTGKSLADATKILIAAGFSVPPNEIKEQNSAELAAGVVIATDPPPNKKVAVGSKIQLTISKGLGRVDKLDDYTGQRYEDAAAALAKLGLFPERVDQVSDTVPAGIVISQDPNTGTPLKNSTVKLVVSVGRGPATVPEVANLAEAEALALINTDFVAVSATESSETVPAGIAVRTDPPVTTELEKGSTVTVFISAGPTPSDVPNVVGKSLAEAQDILTQAGFVTSTTGVDVTDPALVGKVISTTPGTGEKLAKGKTVVLNFGLTLVTTTPPPTVPIETVPPTEAPTTPAPTPPPSPEPTPPPPPVSAP